jgi:hypothetical protein
MSRAMESKREIITYLQSLKGSPRPCVFQQHRYLFKIKKKKKKNQKVGGEGEKDGEGMEERRDISAVELDELKSGIGDEHIAWVEALVREGHLSHAHEFLSLHMEQSSSVRAEGKRKVGRGEREGKDKKK